LPNAQPLQLRRWSIDFSGHQNQVDSAEIGIETFLWARNITGFSVGDNVGGPATTIAGSSYTHCS
jgi:hypothetical protein